LNKWTGAFGGAVGYALTLCRNRTAAVDLVQESIVRALWLNCAWYADILLTLTER
jgi:hypothetical protein